MAPTAAKKNAQTNAANSAASAAAVELKAGGLQAIVIADSLEDAFRPITHSTAKCLLEICGVPLLAHTLDFLRRNSFTDVLLVTTDQKRICKFLESSRYKRSMKIEVFKLKKQKVLSFGDILREIDDRAVNLHDHFLLMMGDSLCTFDLAPALEQHRKTKAADKDAIMTKLFASTFPNSRHRTLVDDTVLVFDSKSREMVCWESIHNHSKFKLDQECLERNSSGNSVEIRYDLADFGMCICDAQVIKLLSESFDFVALRDDFCKDILTKSIKSETIYIHILEVGEESQKQMPFAVRTADPRTFLAANLAVLERLTYPIVPDAVAIPNQPVLVNIGRSTYKAKDAKMGTTVDFGPASAALPGSAIGDNAIVRRSIVGRNCTLGADVVLEGCILQDDVQIEDGAKCYDAFLATGVKVGAGAKLMPGCVLGADVVIGPNVNLPPATKVTCFERKTKANRAATASIMRKNIKAADNSAVPEPSKDDRGVEADDEEDEEDSDEEDEEEDDQGGSLDSSVGERGLSAEVLVYRPRRFVRIEPERLATLTDVSLLGKGARGVLCGHRSPSGSRSLGAKGEVLLPPTSLGGNVSKFIKMTTPCLQLESDSDVESDADGETSADDEGDYRIAGERDGDANDPLLGGFGNATHDDDPEMKAFAREIQVFVQSGFSQPHVMHYKLMEAKSYRVTKNNTDQDVLTAAVPCILDLLKGSPLNVENCIEKLKAVEAPKVFDSFFSDESETDHGVLFDAVLIHCLGNLPPADQRPATNSPMSSNAAAIPSDAVYGHLASLSFVLQLLGNLEITDDELTVKWHREALLRAGSNEDILAILKHPNLLAYIAWLDSDE